jgi:hypothetical protein
MPEAGREKTMDEILEQVQREYAEQAKSEAQTHIDAPGALHDISTSSPKGLPGWKKLTRNQIEQARQHVDRERVAVQRRHTAELKELDAEQDAVDKLERLITAFSQKHGASGLSGP